ncbi:hypothetical protein BKA70DRAFT_1222606 [Coprinopsis sp. MPI-PUGE-AT-0042]|nr:hypothetical protein BKA70DRAFT_1239367 [Coprinopsis sp. MPI-PUGE-AT-0042]KAH6908378.1 hypothetical protein BKA70DRAFT_1222606 [Coprinopsis sp. MPI-PUGE-AT-0042]
MAIYEDDALCTASNVRRQERSKTASQLPSKTWLSTICCPGMSHGAPQALNRSRATRAVEWAKRCMPKLKKKSLSAGSSQAPIPEVIEGFINAPRAVGIPLRQSDPALPLVSPAQSGSTSFEPRRQEQHNAQELIANTDKELPPIPAAIAAPEQQFVSKAYSSSALGFRPLTREAACQDTSETRNYSTIINVEKAGNLFTGTNYGEEPIHMCTVPCI